MTGGHGPWLWGANGARSAPDLHFARYRPYARDLGYSGAPFPWNEEDRRHLRARLDALYFHLYGLYRDDAAYILSTFPIIKRKDEAEFGRYRTKELILAYMNALAAGDTDAHMAV